MEKIEILNPRWEALIRDEVILYTLDLEKSGWLDTSILLLSFKLIWKKLNFTFWYNDT
jgi:hypothetical protein